MTPSPRFRLTLQNGEVAFYEPQTSRLSREDGTRLPEGRVAPKTGFKEALRISSVNPGRKIRSAKKIKISLGLKCNYSCSYCSQAFHRTQEKSLGRADVENLVAKIREAFTIKDGKGVRFEFWGGEPLVYWATLKPLAELLRAHYPQAEMSIITNGSLLTREKIDWLRTMGFLVAISHDGPGQGLRGKDPLENPRQLEMIRSLVFELSWSKKVSFNCVLSRENPSLKAIYSSLREKIGFDFPLSTEGVVSSYENEKHQLGPRNNEEARALWSQLFDDCLQVAPNGQPFLSLFPTIAFAVKDFMSSLEDARPAAALGQKCGMDREDQLSFDMNGLVTTCQNVSAETKHKIGHIDELEKVSLNTAKHWSHHDNCRNCPVVQLCKGSCMFMDGADRRPTCDAHFSHYFGVFALAIFMLTGQKLVKIEGERIRIENQKELFF